MDILIYVRPKSESFFRNVADGVFSKPRIVTYSDFKNIADFWAGKYIYNSKYDKTNDEFEKNAPDILPRCRTLRKMPADLAYKLCRRYWNGMEEFFSEHHFDYLLTMPVDCYSMDILFRIAEKYRVRIISVLGAPFKNYGKITSRGEYNKVREKVSDQEIKKFVDLMTKIEYLTHSEIRNIQQNHWSIYKHHIRRRLIENFYYPLLKLKDHDPWNYHYNMWYFKGIPFNNFYDSKYETRFTHIDELDINPKTTVYYPMHLIPEMTTDYWCTDTSVTNYNKYILDMINNADSGITFIIKEHPAMYGKRLLSFYDDLNSKSNVILLHPLDRSNNLLLGVENVVVDNGTVGIEALMRGKRVLCLSDNYYYRFHPNAFRIERVTKKSLTLPLHKFDNYDFMKHLLQGCFPSDFVNSRNGIPKSNPQQVIDGIKSYLKVNGLNF